MKVLVNIICRNGADKDGLTDMIECCKGSIHDVTVNVYDYCLAKTIKEDLGESSSDGFKQLVTEVNYEDVKEHERNVKALVKASDYTAVLDIESALVLEPCFLDMLGLEFLEDENYCAVYSDFYSQTRNGYKVYVHQKSFPLANTSIPLLAFSLQDYIEHADKENVKGFILSSKLSKHTPMALCSVINA